MTSPLHKRFACALATALWLVAPWSPAALAQGTVLQAGPVTPGHAPMYSTSGTGQPIVQDSGAASGGAVGLGLSEFLQVNRSATGTGPNGMHSCFYSAATATGAYSYFCFDAAAPSGAQIAIGTVGGAAVPLQFLVNGQLYPFPGGSATFPTVRTVTANATIATTDCQNIVQAGTGSTGQFTVTLPSISGFTPGCTVTLKNGDTARGKQLAGFPAGLLGTTLWPEQAITVAVVNGAWAILSNPGAWQATVSITLYVDHANGSDSGTDCLATGTSACRTIYHAYQLLQGAVAVPLGSAQLTIQSDCGFTESPPGALLGAANSGNGVVFILGNGSAPGSCTWTTAGVVIDDGARISLNGFRMANVTTGQTSISVTKQGLLVFSNMLWGPATGGANLVIGDGGVAVYEGGSYTVGDATCAPTCFNYHIINDGGTIEMVGATVSVPNALTFNAWYAASGSGSNTNFGTNTFTGAGAGAGSTGQPYSLQLNASIQLFGLTTFPGNGTPLVVLGACNDGGCAGTTFSYGNAPSLAQNSTYYCGTATCSNGDASTSFLAPNNGIVNRLRVAASAAPAAGQTFVATLRLSGGATALTCTISSPATSCSDTNLAHSIALSAGDSYWVHIALSATSGAAAFGYSLQYDFTPGP